MLSGGALCPGSGLCVLRLALHRTPHSAGRQPGRALAFLFFIERGRQVPRILPPQGASSALCNIPFVDVP